MLTIADGVSVTIKSLTITGGSGGYQGGGIVNPGTLTFADRSSVSTNSAQHGGGIFNHRGGVTIRDQNSIHDDTPLGGGVAGGFRTLTIGDQSSISHNIV